LRRTRAKTTSNPWAIALAFVNGIEIRTPREKVIEDRAYSGTYHTMVKCRDGKSMVRDEVRVTKTKNGKRITYYLWERPIAIKEGDILTLGRKWTPDEFTINPNRAWNILHEFGRTLWLNNIPRKVRIGFSKTGWGPACWYISEPYPLRVNLKAKRILNNIDLSPYYRKLVLARTDWNIKYWMEVCKGFGPLPTEIMDKVNMKLMRAKLNAT
jgi:hypothetical protein